MINEAIEFAAKAHEGQLRKGTKETLYCSSDRGVRDCIGNDR